MIQERLKVSKQGALNLVGELSLREMTAGEGFGLGDRLIPEPSLYTRCEVGHAAGTNLSPISKSRR
jgi:HTH DNA binding domain